MDVDARNVVVTENACRSCGGGTIDVYHQLFPELRIGDRSAGEAAERLVRRLEESLDTVSDEARRQTVLQALADARAFLDRQGDAHPARDLAAH